MSTYARTTCTGATEGVPAATLTFNESTCQPAAPGMANARSGAAPMLTRLSQERRTMVRSPLPSLPCHGPHTSQQRQQTSQQGSRHTITTTTGLPLSARARAG